MYDLHALPVGHIQLLVLKNGVAPLGPYGQPGDVEVRDAGMLDGAPHESAALPSSKEAAEQAQHAMMALPRRHVAPLFACWPLGRLLRRAEAGEGGS